MSLANVQHLLALLYTDGNFRTQFFANPIATSANFDLTTIEIEQLRALNPHQVQYFARSLHYKRRREAGSFLSRSASVLADSFNHWFDQYLNSDGAKADKAPLNDALEFTRFLLQQLPLSERFAREVITYEQTCLQANQAPRYFVVRWFNCTVSDLRHPDPQLSTNSNAVKNHCTLALWWRPTANSLLKHYLLKVW